MSTEEARGGSEATAKDVPGGRVLLIQHSTPPGRPTSLPSVRMRSFNYLAITCCIGLCLKIPFTVFLICLIDAHASGSQA